jgi:tetratricopeptide (TPR) repeat protein
VKGLALVLQGKNAAAENYVDQGLMFNPNYYAGWSAKGIIDEDKGDRAAAIFDYNKAIKLSPADTVSLQALYKLEHPQ